MSNYRVPLTNSLSNTQGTVSVTSTGPCPRVLSVDIRSWRPTGGGVDDIDVVLELDPAHLTDAPVQLNFDVRITAPNLANGRPGLLADGYDGLRRWSEVDASFHVRGESYADPWASVTTMDVKLTA